MNNELMNHEQASEEKSKKKRKVKYKHFTIDKTNNDLFEKISKMHCFKTQGKAILLIKFEGKTDKQIFDEKLDALTEAINEKLRNKQAKVKLLVEE